ncbi:MAG: hypothetical protein N2115_02710 [bacterium]|nr:hypothetical protein [bacterium]
MKLRIWTDMPYGHSYLQNSYSFLGSGRLEWVPYKFSNCRINEFNVEDTISGGSTHEAGHYYSNSDVRVYSQTIENNYPDRREERLGYTAAHEIGHGLVRYGHLPVPFNNHLNCLMNVYVTSLPENCQAFCTGDGSKKCQQYIKIKLGNNK